jgi:hypothetical protein
VQVRRHQRPDRERVLDDGDGAAGARPQGDGKGADRVRHAVIGHAAAFSTWHSLCREQGLADGEAAEVMATLVEAVGAGS